MTLSSELFDVRSLIERTWYRLPIVDGGGAEVAYAITAPAKTAVGRVSMVGAGGWYTGGADGNKGPAGGGAAFARKKFSASPGEGFTAYVGNPHLNVTNFSTFIPNGDGSSRFIRNTGSVLLCKAAASFGALGSYGLASNSVGDVKRDGSPRPGYDAPGTPGNDEADTYSLGFKAATTTGPYDGKQMASHGVGGRGTYRVDPAQSFTWQVVPGCGLICVEWFTEDPGY
jgi:hypothetical protein